MQKKKRNKAKQSNNILLTRIFYIYTVYIYTHAIKQILFGRVDCIFNFLCLIQTKNETESTRAHTIIFFNLLTSARIFVAADSIMFAYFYFVLCVFTCVAFT